MKKKIFSKRGAVLLAAVLVFLVSLFTLQAALTGGFRVQQRSVNWYTDEGVNLSGTLFVPENATQETPAAGIVVAPGGNTPHTFYASYCIELSRRGYVVLAYDYYGTMSSDFSNDGASGAIAAMKYLTSLSFVDSNRLGATGHSNGGAQASAAITSEYAAAAENRSVLFIGCGIPSEDLTVYDSINVGAIWGKLDEAGQGTFWDVYHEDALNFSGFATLVGEESPAVQPGHWYEDAASGAARVVYTPNTFHSLSNIMPGCVTDILTYFNTTLGGNVTGLSVAGDCRAAHGRKPLRDDLPRGLSAFRAAVLRLTQASCAAGGGTGRLEILVLPACARCASGADCRDDRDAGAGADGKAARPVPGAEHQRLCVVVLPLCRHRPSLLCRAHVRG